MYIKAISVSDLNGYIKKIMDNDFILNNAMIKGEISNFKLHSSGHLYFSLKDEGSRINCVMFRQNTNTLSFKPSDGMKVLVKGRVSVYAKDGSYQIYCEEMKPEGIGELYIEFQKLKEKLEKGGFFAESHKKMLPLYPQKVGIITSPTGAAIQDIINVATRRNKNVELLIYPSLVQGIAASSNLIEGLNYLDNRGDIDVIILARGGGSMEELWAFNDEELAMAIYNCKTPLITGIGHEVDFTIADFASDRRAPTPSAAAELAVWRREDLVDKLNHLHLKIYNKLDLLFKDRYNKVNLLLKSIQFNNPLNYIVNQYNSIDKLRQSLDNNYSKMLTKEKNRLGELNLLLTANNPLNILNKGFAVITTEDNKLIKDTETLRATDKIVIKLKDGETKTKVDIIN